MAIDCDPDALAEVSSCLNCIPPGSVDAIKIYLLAVTAGLQDMTATELMEASKCYSCIPEGYQKAVQNYLLCQIANA